MNLCQNIVTVINIIQYFQFRLSITHLLDCYK